MTKRKFVNVPELQLSDVAIQALRHFLKNNQDKFNPKIQRFVGCDSRVARTETPDYLPEYAL